MNQATVTVDGNVWTVSVASTYSELLAGLSGVASIFAGTGMLFDMGSDQDYISVNMSEMLFSLDILFVNSSGGVVGVLRDVVPGEAVAFSRGNGLGARFFMEVNAGELVDVSVGDSVVIEGLQPPTESLIVTVMSGVVAMGLIVPMVAAATAMGLAQKPKPKKKGVW